MASLALAIERFVSFAKENSIDPAVDQSDLAIDLIRMRPGVVAEAMDNFPEFRTWVVRMIIKEFERQVQQSDSAEVPMDRPQLVRMRLCMTCREVYLPLKTLEGASMLLSVWEDHYRRETEIDLALSKTLLANLLQSPSDNSGESITGLASAVILSTTTPKVPVKLVS